MIPLKMWIYTTFLAILFVKIQRVLCGTLCNDCDCTISANNQPEGVISSNTNCMEGTVSWTEPAYAVRLELDPEYSYKFLTCFIVKSTNRRIKVSYELGKKNVTFPDNDANLKKVFSGIGESWETCIESTKDKPVVLYVEMERGSTHSSSAPKVTVRYLMEGIYADLVANPPDECQPCSEEQILKAYCSSAIVVEGRMTEVRDNNQKDKTEIHVLATKVIAQSEKLFFRPQGEPNSIKGTIYVSKRCGVKYGPGRFLFMGKVRLGRSSLGCAPYLTDWHDIYRRAAEENRLPCTNR